MSGRRGDRALIHYTQRFDGIRLEVGQLEVEKREVSKAYKKIPSDFLATLKKAARRIRKFHQLAARRSTLWHTPGTARSEKGIRLGQIIKPLERVGIYVPGGKASYPSTVLMAAIPARIAGVQQILMTTPAQREGIDPTVLVAADLAGVDRDLSNRRRSGHCSPRLRDEHRFPKWIRLLDRGIGM